MPDMSPELQQSRHNTWKKKQDDGGGHVLIEIDLSREVLPLAERSAWCRHNLIPRFPRLGLSSGAHALDVRAESADGACASWS